MVRGTEEGEATQNPGHQTHSVEDRRVLETQGEVHLIVEVGRRGGRPPARSRATVAATTTTCRLFFLCVCVGDVVQKHRNMAEVVVSFCNTL